MAEHIPSSRSDQREEIKLRLEYLKTAVSSVGIAAILFASLQWRQSNLIAQETAYQRMSTEWRTHLDSFIASPELRPYFYDGKPLDGDDPHRNAVLAIANIRLDAIDAVLTTAARRWSDVTITGWRRTFIRAFAESPVLCAELREHWGEYGLSRQVASEGCVGHSR